MPAMSPTMTEGNIASWKVAEGASYAAGDVILEIETDKATMDVEAQDDGVLAKILVQDGSKAVQVGTSIAVMAEPGDDLASLKMPERTAVTESNIVKSDSAVEKAEKPVETKQANAPTPHVSHTAYDSLVNQDGSPLLPSVIATMRKLGLTEIKDIKPTGPKGRLLKGDVLAFAKKIDQDAPAKLQQEAEKRGKLDLSNIKKAAPVQKPETQAAAQAMEVEDDKIVELTRSVDLSELILLAEKLSEDSRVHISVKQLAAKAARRALQDVPAFGLTERSQDDLLFDEIVGTSAYNNAVYEPEPLEGPSERRALDLDASEYLESSFIELPEQANIDGILSLQAVQVEDPLASAPANYDILDFLADKPLPAPSQAMQSTSRSSVVASLHFREGSINPRTASIYLDRVSQYIESPVHLML
ncbi:hypothetical protein BCR37DRAFT_393566 [Protomyces lactucae-debilis]|uniref:Single hybrid motif-containing protein n=1 Tax=Protomyces lactucae-debilis TaxID=2754530 RepID=A0A1Y2FAH1_PROLT|nr:uncharacterized protein BCR37DRAFT_393566 [Protomyces lactucae-debilis]ORY80922.1 hypothetical protein BCR37DRAFT_393566 [Protomyces lactucae-debilis]